MKLVVATHNEGKLVEIRRILEEDLGADAANIELVSAGSLHLPDPVETGVTFEENALLKARDVASCTGLPAIADDSGLIVDVMGNAPGILSARWAGAHGHDKANNALLLAQIEDIPDDKRTARFRCAAALVVPDTEAGIDVTGDAQAADSATAQSAPVTGRYAIKSEVVKLGDMVGRIIRKERGEHGFGYDPLFVPNDQPAGRTSTDPDYEGEPLTSAEMTPAEKNAISHRGKALKALVPDIEALLG
ncbi:non-canonical purine NTP pyrophosphatase, rdgB/HAM1 family [Bifidobacterium saguini DSM 23967]|uniref:dITP/XTP pyrophosphatase n=2 Tax=Bifidobacterium saguini TaxID=762210 RepID=A0A087D8D8_9BIFI|nr:non-canonical purine NTP pyrophosphatase [Bifidobacterium saguini]KFI91788.1 non-canonical purine NTP pyrophosphatase, rdgB/HAM1 family [Bifidobacterium saguini DSM 23967]QTB90196.1 non-canonical purine NTP pyrophosphatase [Bifidobacterium saguini]